MTLFRSLLVPFSHSKYPLYRCAQRLKESIKSKFYRNKISTHFSQTIQLSFEILNKFVATLLLACFGMIVPLGAIHVRVCLLEEYERTEDCCEKCPSTHGDCCADMDTLPEIPTPGASTEIPPFIAVELLSCLVEELTEVPRQSQTPAFSQPIRGPDTPAAYRSVLSVWSI